jgi:hypothetical protein
MPRVEAVTELGLHRSRASANLPRDHARRVSDRCDFAHGDTRGP